MALYLTEAKVTELVSMPEIIAVVEQAFREMGQGEAINRPRQRVRMPNGILHVMPAGLPKQGYLGFKYYSSFRGKTRFWVHLIDGNNGDLLAVLQADRLGQQRTGAASGVATKFLARQDSHSVGIIGTGWQAESQLEAVCAVRPIRVGKCYSRDQVHRTEFATKMTAQLGVEIRAVEEPEQAVRDSDIVITATSAREPVVRGEWLALGTHVNAVGSNRAESREIDDQVVTRSGLIVVDSIEQTKIESGDLIEPAANGLISWDRVRELGDVVAGKTSGRTNDSMITLFKSNGIALEDVAAAIWVYQRARERGIGRQIEL